MTVRIVRLKDGSDVISQIEKSEKQMELIYPMTFSLVNKNLVLQHWLPLAVMKEVSVVIPLDEVVCVMEPTENFEEYYNSAVSKISSALGGKDEEEMDEMMEALDELENSKGIQIH